MEKEKSDIFLHKALKEMFRIVGQKYDPEFVKQDNWYSKYTWTQAQEKQFLEWFKKTIRKDLSISKRHAELECMWFNLNYGWKGRGE